MAEIDIDRIKANLIAAKKARGPDPRLLPQSRRESSADEQEIKKFLAPVLEKAGLDVGAFEKILKQDKAYVPRKPTAEAVKRHAWMKGNVVKRMKARAGARRGVATSAPAIAPFNPPPVTEMIQPFFIWANSVDILTDSNLAADDNLARVMLQTDSDGGGVFGICGRIRMISQSVSTSIHPSRSLGTAR